MAGARMSPLTRANARRKPRSNARGKRGYGTIGTRLNGSTGDRSSRAREVGRRIPTTICMRAGVVSAGTVPDRGQQLAPPLLAQTSGWSKRMAQNDGLNRRAFLKNAGLTALAGAVGTGTSLATG